MEERAEIDTRIVPEGEQLPEGHSIAPDVRLVSELLRKLQALRSKPAKQRARECGGERGRGWGSPVDGDVFLLRGRVVVLVLLELPGQPKVRHLHHSGRHHQHVPGGQVSVHQLVLALRGRGIK